MKQLLKFSLTILSSLSLLLIRPIATQAAALEFELAQAQWLYGCLLWPC